LAYSIRDRLIRMWLNTQRDYFDKMVKQVYYLSLEFLTGRFLMNYLTNMGMEQGCEAVLDRLGLALEDLEEVEWDAGLGNGGLGRLASCYLDSIASLKIPGYGYGILYDYGIFYQNIMTATRRSDATTGAARGTPGRSCGGNTSTRSISTAEARATVRSNTPLWPDSATMWLYS
jgi:glycogen phosphorylase